MKANVLTRMMKSAAILIGLMFCACGAAEKPEDETVQTQTVEPPCDSGQNQYCERLVNLCLSHSDENACWMLGKSYEYEGKVGKARAAYEVSCKLGRHDACDKLKPRS